jgi:predicted acyltransferase
MIHHSIKLTTLYTIHIYFKEHTLIGKIKSVVKVLASLFASEFVRDDPINSDSFYIPFLEKILIWLKITFNGYQH